MQCTSVHSISRQSTGWQYVRRQNTGGLTTYWQPTDWQILTGKVPACILLAGKVHHVQNTSRQYIGRQSTSWQYMGRQSSTCATWLACKLPTTENFECFVYVTNVSICPSSIEFGHRRVSPSFALVNWSHFLVKGNSIYPLESVPFKKAFKNSRKVMVSFKPW